MEGQGWRDWVSRTHWAPNLHCPLVGSCHVTPDISKSMLSNTYVTMVRAEKALTQQKTPLLSTYQLITRISMLMIILALQVAGISLQPWTLFWVIVVNFLFPLSGATPFWSFFRRHNRWTAAQVQTPFSSFFQRQPGGHYRSTALLDGHRSSLAWNQGRCCRNKEYWSEETESVLKRQSRIAQSEYCFFWLNGMLINCYHTNSICFWPREV